MNRSVFRLIAGLIVAGTMVALVPNTSELAYGATDGATPLRIDTWSRDELTVLATMAIDKLPARPRDPSNAAEHMPEAVKLGQRFFEDARFSADGQVSCATCHAPDKQFQDGLPVGHGVGTGTRRTMPIAGASNNAWFFWDGRKDSLWAQALGPLEDAVEHGGNRMRFAHLVAKHYRADYEAIFGAMPSLAGLPADAGPLGTAEQKAAWAALSEQARNDVNRVFANVGKSIAAYEVTLTPGETRFDRYVRATMQGDAAGQQVLSAQEVNGLRLFIGKGQCATCHSGPLLSDQAFHNTGVPQRDAARPDRGRAAAVARVQADEFNCLGRFSDAKAEQCGELQFIADDDPTMLGAFKTPGLRNVAERAPYMHAGQIASLEAVVAHYAQSPRATIGHSELAHPDGRGGHAERKPIRLSKAEQADIVRFLGTLSGPIVETKR